MFSHERDSRAIKKIEIIFCDFFSKLPRFLHNRAIEQSKIIYKNLPSWNTNEQKKEAHSDAQAQNKHRI